MTLHVHRQGSGPDLALIHGWGFAGAVWAPVVDRLAGNFRVHCVDLPGYGGSRDLGPESIQTTADQVMAVLPERIVLCGWSLGAHVVLAALARHDQRVGDVVLVGATPCFVKRSDWPDAVESSVLAFFAAALRRDPAALLAHFAALSNQGDAAAPAVTDRLLALLAELPATDALMHGLDLLRDLDLRPLLPSVTHRALLVHGGRDPLMPLAAARWAAAALPRARLEVFAESAHAPFLSQPERFAQLLADFALTPADDADAPR